MHGLMDGYAGQYAGLRGGNRGDMAPTLDYMGRRLGAVVDYVRRDPPVGTWGPGPWACSARINTSCRPLASYPAKGNPGERADMAPAAKL